MAQCNRNNTHKLVLSTDGSNGSLFNFDDNESCCLNVSFDFLIEFNCDDLLTCGDNHIIDNILTNLNMKLYLTYDDSGVRVFNNTEFYSVGNFQDYIYNNTNTGLYINGGDCDGLYDQISNELGENCDRLSATTLNSNWVHVEHIICDVDVINEIKGKEIKFGIEEFDCSCNHSILLDNIQLEKQCTITRVDTKLVEKCPGFELTKEIDDKKSWVNLYNHDGRDYELEHRDTHYEVNNERLVINTKELDLSLDGANVIECGVMDYLKNDDCVLDVNITSGVTLNDLLTTTITNIKDVQTFREIIIQQLTDVKNRKILQSYPTLRLLYEHYLGLINSQCGIGPNQYTYCDLNSFTGLVNKYWYELFEQVIPATSLWGATTVYRNSIFDQQKYQYKNYGIDICDGDETCGNIKSSGGSISVEYIEHSIKIDGTTTAESVTTSCGVTTPVVSVCNGLNIYYMDDGSSFINKIGMTHPIPQSHTQTNALIIREEDDNA